MEEFPKLNITKSQELFKEASGLVPGGVLGARKGQNAQQVGGKDWVRAQ